MSAPKKCHFLFAEYLDERGTSALSISWNIYIYLYIWCTSIATFSHDDSGCVRAVGNPPSHLFHVFSSIHKQRWHHQRLSSKITLCSFPLHGFHPLFFKKTKNDGVFSGTSRASFTSLYRLRLCVSWRSPMWAKVNIHQVVRKSAKLAHRKQST